MSILLAWLGHTDLRAAEASTADAVGPILNAAKAMPFSAVHLLSNADKPKTNTYVRWLERQIDVPVTAHFIKLTSPTHFEEIYQAAWYTGGGYVWEKENTEIDRAAEMILQMLVREHRNGTVVVKQFVERLDEADRNRRLGTLTLRQSKKHWRVDAA